MVDYIIRKAGKDATKVQDQYSKEVENVNKKLEKAKVALLPEPDELTYIAQCTLKKALKETEDGVSEAKGVSADSLEDAVAQAEAKFGGREFKVNEYKIVALYSVKSKQNKAINTTTEKKKKSTPATYLGAKGQNSIIEY